MGQDKLKKASLSAAQSPVISVSVIYHQVIVYWVWPCNYIKLSVNLVKPDWYVSCQATKTQITAIRHWGVTNMSGAIQENPCYVVFKKTRFVWWYPCKNWYHYSVTFHGIVMLVMLCVFWVVFADCLSVDLHDYTSPVLIVHLCLYLGILIMLTWGCSQTVIVGILNSSNMW